MPVEASLPGKAQMKLQKFHRVLAAIFCICIGRKVHIETQF